MKSQILEVKIDKLFLWIGFGIVLLNFFQNSISSEVSEKIGVTEIEEDHIISWISLKMKWVPHGGFMMGSPTNEVGRDEDEILHSVKVDNGFWIGEKEVTQEQWKKVMGFNPSEFSGKRSLPVENVNWEMCLSFCEKLTKIEHQSGRLSKAYKYTLPTEIQWEYACREAGRSKTPFSFGNALNSFKANIRGLSPYGNVSKGPTLTQTRQVGSYAPNALGLYDMHGNVYEWCLEDFSPYESSGSKTGNKSSNKIIRGGSWFSKAVWCRSANRYSISQNYRINTIGFRICLIKCEQI